MSLLSTFLKTNLVPVLESTLASYEPSAQAVILAELQALTQQIVGWVASKTTSSQAPSVAPESSTPPTA